MSKVIVTTCDLKEDYEIIGPIFFQISNKGLFGSSYSRLYKEYKEQIERMRSSGQLSPVNADFGFLYGEWGVGHNDFDNAFYICVEEMKKRAKMMGANAVIGMRQDIDLDTSGFQYFYLQMYGTAVRYKPNSKNQNLNYEDLPSL